MEKDNSRMETTLTNAEYQVINDVLKRMDAENIPDFNNAFDFLLFVHNDFLIEMPKIVDILASHKKEIRYDAFLRSLARVVETICEINNWRFYLEKMQELGIMLYKAREKSSKGYNNKEV